MSSPSRTNRSLEAWLLLAACLAATAWYAKPQIIYSLVFLYDLAQTFFPGVLPRIPGR